MNLSDDNLFLLVVHVWSLLNQKFVENPYQTFMRDFQGHRTITYDVDVIFLASPDCVDHVKCQFYQFNWFYRNSKFYFSRNYTTGYKYIYIVSEFYGFE